MKKLLFSVFLLLFSYTGFCQDYFPMPANNATWRYRSKIVDDIVNISDFMLFLNGQDTVIFGNTYHQIFSRNSNQAGPLGFDPPIVAINATIPDVYFGGIREIGKKVYFFSGGSEQLIFDFNAVVGSYIPAYTGTIRVVSIDSILIGSIYHKRYKTTDSTYYVIEGVGSSRGLIPGLNDGSGLIIFHCYTHQPDTSWSPDAAIPCTYIYPYVYGASVKTIENAFDVTINPNPVNETLHIGYMG